MYTLPFYTGFQDLDEQHLTLFRLLNTLENDLSAIPGTAVFSEIFTHFGAELVRHTNAEEALMEILPIPRRELATHQKEHRRIIEDYTNLNLALMNGLVIERKETVSRAYDWVVEHMVRYDSELPNHNWVSP